MTANTTNFLQASHINNTFKLCVNQSYNPYYGIFGAAEVVEVVVLCIFALLGTFGNLLVICSVIHAGKAFKHGNVFIINLAITDFVVCSFFLPTVIANVIKTQNALPDLMCKFAGYIVTVDCACSVCNLALIAVSRYWAVVRSATYKIVYSKRNTLIMAISAWIWSNLLVLPTVFGWSRLIYDNKMAECGWDDCVSLAYNIFLMVAAIFVPVSVIIFCYWRLFVAVKMRGKILKQMNSSLPRPKESAYSNVHMKREISLLKTLAVAITMFVLCWLPYGIIVLFFVADVPPRVKKASARLGLSNSVMNFIVYGAMNHVYRKGYKDFFSYCYNRMLISFNRLNKHSSSNSSTKIQSRVQANKIKIREIKNQEVKER